MAHWDNKLDLREFFLAYKRGELAADKLAGKIAEAIRAMPIFPTDDEGLEDICIEFEDLAEGGDETTADDIDNAMETLYDWGDLITGGGWPARRKCWISTF